jgi:hypothetical protein
MCSRIARTLAGSLVVSVMVATAPACAGGDDEAAVSETGSTSGSLEDIDACALLTSDEIRAATGQEPGTGIDPMDGVSASAPICAWPSADGSITEIAQILVSIASADSYESYRQSMEQEGFTDLQQVDGPGRFNALLGGLNMLQSFGERFMVQVMFEPAPGRDFVEAATELTRAALGRLE